MIRDEFGIIIFGANVDLIHSFLLNLFTLDVKKMYMIFKNAHPSRRFSTVFLCVFFVERATTNTDFVYTPYILTF